LTNSSIFEPFASKRLRIALLLIAAFWVWYPVTTMMQESIGIDLGPLYSGRGTSFVGKFFQGSGGLKPNYINYVRAFTINAFPKLVFNSTLIAMTSIIAALLVGIPAAFSFVVHKYPGKRLFVYSLLVFRTISPFAVLVPFFILYGRLGLFDTYGGMSIVYLLINLPAVVLLMRGFFKDLPKETYEAASLSGASDLDILRRVALPLVIPGMIAVVIFTFVGTWNEYIYALTLTGGATKTVSRGVWAGFGESIEGFKALEFDELNAAGTLALIPAVILIILMRKYLARGWSLGTVK